MNIKEEQKRVFLMWDKVADNIYNMPDLESWKKKRAKEIIEEIKDFIKFIPDKDFFKEILYYFWIGKTDREIAKLYGIPVKKLREIYKQRHSELEEAYKSHLLELKELKKIDSSY